MYIYYTNILLFRSKINKKMSDIKKSGLPTRECSGRFEIPLFPAYGAGGIVMLEPPVGFILVFHSSEKFTAPPG